MEQNTQMNAQVGQYIETFTNAFTKGLFSQGIIKGIEPEKLNRYFANPDFNQDVLADVINYYYITNAEIRQLLESVESLPSLVYRIKFFERVNENEKYLTMLKKTMHSASHLSLTRDLMKQVASTGNVAGIWIGKGKNYYPYIFSDTCSFNLVRDFEGRLRIALDLNWLGNMSVLERDLYFEKFSGILTRSQYDKYLISKTDNRFHLVPFERSIVLRTGTTSRNQINGSNWINPVLFDVLHKKKLKDVEQTIANKIINAVAVLTMGQNTKQGDKDRDYDSIPPKLVRSIHENVKAALSNGAKEGLSLVTIPNFSKIDFPDIKSDGLDGDKFNQTDSDIRSGLGISNVMLNGEGANVGSARLNLEIFYKRLGVMLEGIESEVYNKLFNLILPRSLKDNYYLEYDKEMPLTLKEKIDYQVKLNDKGWSSRHLMDAIGLDFDSILEQTVYENEVLELNTTLLIPPKTSYTTSNADKPVGRPSTDTEEEVTESVQIELDI